MATDKRGGKKMRIPKGSVAVLIWIVMMLAGGYIDGIL